MQPSGAKQRQRSGEKRRRSEGAAGSASSGSRPDARLCVSLLCVSVCLFIAWLHVQQSARLAEVTQENERLRGESRGLRALEERMSAVSLERQTSVNSTLESWAALRAEQEAAELLLRSLEERVAAARRSPELEELQELQRRSRAAHGSVTQQLNEAEALLQALSRRLQEVQDGTGRNGRALERSEEEDAQRLRSQLDWSESAGSGLLRQLQRLEERGLELRSRLDTRAPLTTHLPAAEDAVRSMLRLRAQLSATYGRLEELQQQCVSQAEVSELQEGFSRLRGQRQQLQLDLSALSGSVEAVERQLSGAVSSRLSSIRTDVRRMAGLEGEVELLLNRTQALEEKVSQTEKMMVRRIGDLLAASIDRVSALRSSSERSVQRLEQLSALAQQLSEAHRQLAQRILGLESGQAKLLKTATFASDLKPKVFSIRQDFAIIQPKLDDLTLRIGLLAEDLMSREEERQSELRSVPEL